MTSDSPAAQLYLATPRNFDPAALALALEAALAAHPVACLRIDLGEAPEEDWREAVNHLMPIAHAHDVALVIAEHHRLVGPLGLDGVHLGTSRTPIRDVRKALGRERIIGAFAGASRHRAIAIAEGGADYVSLGPVAQTGALGDGAVADDDLFQWWAEMIETPSVAEGGLAPADAARLAPYADFFVPDPKIWTDPAGIEAALAPYAAAIAR